MKKKQKTWMKFKKGEEGGTKYGIPFLEKNVIKMFNSS